MSKNSLKFRWISDQCYEFVLPNGKHLITDPYISSPGADLSPYGYRKFSVQEVERADYIVVSHSHYDHTGEIGYLCEKFKAKLFVGDITAAMIADFFDLDYSLLYPMAHGQTVELEDLKITAMRTRHFGSGSYRAKSIGLSERMDGVTGYDEINVLGVAEVMDYFITLSDNTRIVFASGRDDYRNNKAAVKAFAPQIYIRQRSASWTIREYAELLDDSGAPLTLPNHQDAIIRKKGKSSIYSYQEFGKLVSDELNNIGSLTQYLCPEPYRWYSLDLNIGSEE